MSRLEEIRGRVEAHRRYIASLPTGSVGRQWVEQQPDDIPWLLDQVATLTAELAAMECERDAALLRAEPVES